MLKLGLKLRLQLTKNVLVLRPLGLAATRASPVTW
jgi:hypothetical protein